MCMGASPRCTFDRGACFDTPSEIPCASISDPVQCFEQSGDENAQPHGRTCHRKQGYNTVQHLSNVGFSNASLFVRAPGNTSSEALYLGRFSIRYGEAQYS